MREVIDLKTLCLKSILASAVLQLQLVLTDGFATSFVLSKSATDGTSLLGSQILSNQLTGTIGTEGITLGMAHDGEDTSNSTTDKLNLSNLVSSTRSNLLDTEVGKLRLEVS